ncbi:MAG: prepilin-type N-terminal cleavage/methylation domain-containing protein [Deltaproteobacteria bacterium]|nr:prepilin-type N-terminal cleavage/methylation domain-containing protein [Deltaproteobacteria bacterium]
MSNKGFTLLELLLALTILAIIVALSFGVFQTGVRAWEKVEGKVAINQRLRIVPELLRRQIASICLPQVLKRNGRDFYFQGDEKSLEFFSRIPLLPENGAAIVYLKYIVQESDRPGQEEMAFFEKNILNLKAEELVELPKEAFEKILSGQRSISFAYLSDPPVETQSRQWLTSWNKEEPDGGQPKNLPDALPRAVRITLITKETDPPLVVIIPLLARQLQELAKSK